MSMIVERLSKIESGSSTAVRPSQSPEGREISNGLVIVETQVKTEICLRVHVGRGSVRTSVPAKSRLIFQANKLPSAPLQLCTWIIMEHGRYLPTTHCNRPWYSGQSGEQQWWSNI